MASRRGAHTRSAGWRLARARLLSRAWRQSLTLLGLRCATRRTRSCKATVRQSELLWPMDLVAECRRPLDRRPEARTPRLPAARVRSSVLEGKKARETVC